MYTEYDESSDTGKTYLGIPKMRRQNELRTE